MKKKVMWAFVALAIVAAPWLCEWLNGIPFVLGVFLVLLYMECLIFIVRRAQK